MCEHKNQREVEDMPIAEPGTLEFVGRFDVIVCEDCEDILSEIRKVD
jgi:hypothetical protein